MGIKRHGFAEMKQEQNGSVAVSKIVCGQYHERVDRGIVQILSSQPGGTGFCAGSGRSDDGHGSPGPAQGTRGQGSHHVRFRRGKVAVSADRPVSIIYNGIEISEFSSWRPVSGHTPEPVVLDNFLNGVNV